MDDTKRHYYKFRLKIRRSLRRQRRQVEDITIQADDSLNKLLFKRMTRLYNVRRFVATWILLVLFTGIGTIWQVRGLDKYYLKLAPATGGIYREGIIGAFTTASPLFAVSSVDVSVSRLIFSGLFEQSPDGSLIPDLAQSITTDKKGLKHTVKLRGDVRWHDGHGFSADDVVFTYGLIKSPDVKSPFFSGWKDVSIVAKDKDTVVFTLPNALSSFKSSLTNGILPKHILEKEDEGDLRSLPFNTVTPVGTGPFLYKDVEVTGSDADTRQEKIILETNIDYYRNRASIDGIVIRSFRSEQDLVEAYKEKEITSMVGLKTVPESLLNDTTTQVISSPLTASVMIFLNNSSDVLKDKRIRQALVQSTDTENLRKSIGYDLLSSDSPFLKSHFSYNPKLIQLGINKKKAEKLLDAAGWKKNKNGKRVNRKGKPLTLRLVSQSLTEYATVVQGIQKQWGELGITVDALLQPEDDIQSGSVVRHDYDVLLYGISMGFDPDVFPYWHSSQNDERLSTRLNLSEYSNKVADIALEGGRTRSDEKLRSAKYRPFLVKWREDAPAIALYQPRFLFIARDFLDGYESGQFNDPSDRFFSVCDWRVRREKTVK